MSILYVMEQGARLVKDNDRIQVKKEDQLLQTVPIFAIDQIVLFGNVTITASMRNYLLDQSVDTVFLTKRGRFRGRLTSYSGSNIELRQQQFRRCDDEDFVLITMGHRSLRDFHQHGKHSLLQGETKIGFGAFPTCEQLSCFLLDKG